MPHYNTILNQMIRMIPRHEIEKLEKKHKGGRKSRVMTRTSQFVAMSFAQLSGRRSLRDTVSGLMSKARNLYHLGIKNKVSRSTLAYANEKKPSSYYEELFSKVYGKCSSIAPKHKFRFKNPLYSMDVTFIDLCLSVFEWAKFRKRKGAIKIHTVFDHRGYLPAFVSITDGKKHDIKVARSLSLPRGSIVVMDRAYTDYRWFHELHENGIYFVTRQKRNAVYRVIRRGEVKKGSGVTSDQRIILTGHKGKECPVELRRIGYRDSETGKHYVFLTNCFHLSAKTICEIYRERWQIELFFKWIKQHLKIKTFLGTSRNAVMTQIWIALILYLLLAWFKFQSKIELSLTQMIRLIGLNLFDKRGLFELFKPPDDANKRIDNRQLSFLEA